MFARRHLDRRNLFRLAAAGLAGGSCSGWLRALAETAKGQRTSKSVILLWMNGGPATIDLWDLKVGHENGGPFKVIETASAGVRISEHLPRLAQLTKDMVIVRSISSREGDHERATHFVRTGYAPQASLDFPDLGALMANELAVQRVLPNFVSIVPPQRTMFNGEGFLGPECAPLVIGQGAAGSDELRVENLHCYPGVTDKSLRARQELLSSLNGRFVENARDRTTVAQQLAASRAMQLMSSEVARAFDLQEEADQTRDRYGRSLFGQSCLLARRLVERGVTFVEATLDGWDTHQQNFERVAALSQQLDVAFASLLGDLHDRGLLASTLVVCLGEFGRTPRINGTVGRDHWPNAWAAVLAGGSIRGGQVIGETSDDGTTVEGQITTVPDLIATICKICDIDPRKQNDSNVGRPIRIADPVATPLVGLV
jgi:uncharacterized protein (DUF1501 family)